MNKWQVAFFFVFGFWIYSLCALIASRHEANQYQRELKATVEECSDAWLSGPIKAIEKYQLEK